MACGIYAIKNKITGRVYIGQSANITERWIRHRYELKNNKHRNPRLQNSFNKYGELNFDFFILKECIECELNILEQNFINENLNNCYNLVLNVDDVRGCKNPFYGKKHSSISKDKMSKWKKENFLGQNNPNYGKKNSLQSLKKMSLGRGKLKESDVLEIVERLKNGEDHQSIAAFFGISRTVITRISNGTRWTNITGGPVFPVVYEDGKRVFQENHKNKIGEKRKGCLHSEETKKLMREKALSRKGNL